MTIFVTLLLILLLGGCVISLLKKGRRKHLIWQTPLTLTVLMMAAAMSPQGVGPRTAEERYQAALSEAETKRAADSAAAQRIASEEAACRPNLQCWAERHLRDATSACKPQIEASARINYRWTSWVTPLQHFRWRDQQAGVVAYEGDELELQNGMGAWVKHAYFCDFDTRTKSVTRVYVREGRV